MPAKKKLKKCKSFLSPKWIETDDGLFSLVLEPNKQITGQELKCFKTNANQIKNLTKKKKPNEEVSEKVIQCRDVQGSSLRISTEFDGTEEYVSTAEDFFAGNGPTATTNQTTETKSENGEYGVEPPNIRDSFSPDLTEQFGETFAASKDYVIVDKPKTQSNVTVRFTLLQINNDSLQTHTLATENNISSVQNAVDISTNGNECDNTSDDKENDSLGGKGEIGAKKDEINSGNGEIDGGKDKIDSSKVAECISNGNSSISNSKNVDGQNAPDVDVDSDDDSDESDDDSFCNQLFNSSEPRVTFVTAQTDSFPCADDSDSEIETSFVKFCINNSSSVPLAEYDETEYRIGFLDLTTEEYSHLNLVNETTVELNINSQCIQIEQNMFNIRRIKVRHVTPNMQQSTRERLWSSLNMGRVQFSSTEPFLAKYENEIYLVGDKLRDEYLRLLKRTKMNAGTAIRLYNDRLCIDLSNRTLEVTKTTSFEKQKEICRILAAPDFKSDFLDEYNSEKFRRYIINYKTNTLLEVDPILIHSSNHDDCGEIYAEIDFLFTESERVRMPEKSTKQDQNEDILDDGSDDEELEMGRLKQYPVSAEVKSLSRNKKLSSREIAKTKFSEFKKKSDTSLRTKEKTYIDAYTMMIQFEEDANSQYLERFNQKDIQLTYHMGQQFYFPITDALSELAGAIDENEVDHFILIPKSKKPPNEKDILGQVIRTREKKIYVEIFKQSMKAVQKSWRDEFYDIFFIVNRTPYQLQHNALEYVNKEGLFTRLINNSYYNCKKLTGKPKVGLKVEKTMLENLNSEQRSAVENMISENCPVLPYVLFGPPGTGKTRTLVAAIEQIVKTTDKNVLVCAMSNAACDEITERLLSVLTEDQMYRFFAKSYKHEKINPRIIKVSNFASEGIIYPSLKFLYKFRVVICTLCSAGCLTRARINKKVWKADHFGYVIIDECASAHETMCLIPIAGLCTSPKKVHAKIILAGDPKQLDAVTRSPRAKQLGFQTSWLEQLCSTNLYSRNATTNKFNECYITQLVKNYRSHPQILSIPNELFYENKLQPIAAEKDTNWYINSKYLPSKQFPIVFRSVQGNCQQSIEHSWFNNKEVEEVVSVIKQLLPPYSKRKQLRQISQSDIGVVTPYRKQRFKLAQKLRRLTLDEVLVGTAETFQGKEKPIMIVSTVRSDGELGFVSEERRLNVVITRAKCLLIIVGDPHTLKKDNNWLRVIKHCYDNNSFVQGTTEFSL